MDLKNSTDNGCKIRITQVCVGPLVGIAPGSGHRGLDVSGEVDTANQSKISKGTIYSPSRRFDITHTPQQFHTPQQHNIDKNEDKKDSKQLLNPSKIDSDRLEKTLPVNIDPDRDPGRGRGVRTPLCAVIELTQLPYASIGI